jgi:uncharacterized protein (DUF362 family)
LGSLVSLVKADDFSGSSLKDCVAKAVGLIGFKFPENLKTVIIKPNLNYYWEWTTGSTTDPHLVGSIIDYLRDRYGERLEIRLAEADASAMRTKHAFEMLGYGRLAMQKNVELFNLSFDTLKEEKVSVLNHQIKFLIPQSLPDADLFINVPKLKVLRHTKISCAMKNVFGCIGFPRKITYHPVLNETIVGVNKVLHPHLNVVEGLIALGRYPVKLGLIMASNDTFSTDWTAAQLMGYKPRSIKFLKIAVKEKVGIPDGICTVGEDPRPFMKEFPRETFLLQNWLLKRQFSMLRLYKRVSGDVIPPFLEETD